MKTKITIIIFFWITLSGASPAVASQSGPGTYTLDALYKAALDHAEHIGIARQAVAIAEYTREQALSVLKPHVTAFGNYRRFSEKEMLGDILLQPQWDGSYGFKAGQTITLNGRELTALRIAEQGIDKSRTDLAGVENAYLYNVAAAFYDVAKLRQTTAIAQADVRRLETHHNAVELKLRLAEVPKTELFRTMAELSQSRAALIETENLLLVARAFLARICGIDETFDIVEVPAAESEAVTESLDTLKTRALANRPEIKGRRLDETIASNEVDYAKGAYWPSLGLEAGWMRMDQEPDPMLEESAYVSLNLAFDLFDGGLKRSQVGAAVARRRQAELARRDAERALTVEVEQSWRNWQTQKGVIRSLESQLHYATENYDAVTRLFEHGMANSVDVMDANTVLVTAQRQLSEANYNLQLALLDIERVTGRFADRVIKQATAAP